MNEAETQAERIDPALKEPQSRRAGRIEEVAAAPGLQRESLMTNVLET
jgi:hypothetical protein